MQRIPLYGIPFCIVLTKVKGGSTIGAKIMKKFRKLSLVTLLAMMLLLTACSGGTGGDAGNTGSKFKNVMFSLLDHLVVELIMMTYMKQLKHILIKLVET